VDDWNYKPAKDLGLAETERSRSVARETGLAGFLGRNLWWWWVRGVLRIAERVEIAGRENFPKSAPLIVIANHSSHLDVLVLATALPAGLRNSVFPLAAGDTFFHTPAVAAFAAGMLNALPMWRKNCGHHALATLRERLVSEPCGYILFPEGTRSRTGEMAAFRPGIGMMVAGTSVPVVPCYLQGTFQSLPPGARWPKRGRIRLEIGKPMNFDTIPDTKEGWKAIADQLSQAVKALAKRA
jgi:1-acyl-sn-glycerol-3-phosphate acyltransferase